MVQPGSVLASIDNFNGRSSTFANSNMLTERQVKTLAAANMKFFLLGRI